jgi:hypothetical protein
VKIRIGFVVTLVLLAALAPPMFAIEGCKYKHPVNDFELAFCQEYQDAAGSWRGTCTMGFGPELPPAGYTNYRNWNVWVQSETGEKCEVVGPTTSLRTILTDHTRPSSLMDQWIAETLAHPEGFPLLNDASMYDMYKSQPDFYTTIFGYMSASGGYTPTMWTATIYGAHTTMSVNHSVKTWWCNVGGQGCFTDTHVQP